jgi:hypothetical protein
MRLQAADGGRESGAEGGKERLAEPSRSETPPGASKHEMPQRSREAVMPHE